MLALLLAWIVIGFILLSFGDMILLLSHSLSKRLCSFNLADKCLAGLCFLTIPLSIWSLWLPSNEFFLLSSFIVCVAYWVINRIKARENYAIVKNYIKSLNKGQIAIIIAFILCLLYFFSWEQEVYDSLIYHHQNIRWNEEFAVVPGLGNLDDKFAFNSNYFLLSAIFTFRYFIGEAIYPLQSFFVVIIFGWILKELFVSKYEKKRVLILVSYILLFGVSVFFMGNTSTDLLPNVIAFYILARLLLYPNLLKTNSFIYIIIPVFLLTCKLSFFPICIISLFLLYYLLREKEYKSLTYVLSIATLIIIPWLIRNIIISGYLVYPIYQIDLLSVDWKIPQEVAIKQKNYIFDIGYYFFRIALKYPGSSIRDPFFINILTDIIYLISFVSVLWSTYFIIKRRKEIKISVKLIYITILASLIVWLTGGPDIRFIVGILCLTICLPPVIKQNSICYKSFSKALIISFIIGIFTWSSFRIYNFQSIAYHSKVIPLIAYKPYSVKDQKKDLDILIEKQFNDYLLNNAITIKINSDLLYDIFPSTIYSHYAKFWPIEKIEARGSSLQNGFRAK